MASRVPEAVLKWLQSVLSTNGYRDINRTYYDVASTLQQHQSLKLRTDIYTSENGSSSLLLNVHGNLPVHFRGSVYGFPISLWMPQEYPWAAPSAFIVPSTDMALRPGQHVSGDGKIYHPYLATWRNETSSLLELLSILQGVFSKEPPLVARAGQSFQSASDHSMPQPPIPPMPPEARAARAGPPSSSSQQAPPPRPPKGTGPAPSKYDSPAPLPPGAQGGSGQYGNAATPVMNGSLRRPNLEQRVPPQQEVAANGWQQYQAQSGPFSPRRSQPPPPTQDQVPQAVQGGLRSHDQPPLSYVQAPTPQSQQIYQQSYQQAQIPPAFSAPSQSNTAYQSTPQPPKPRPAEDLLTSPSDNPLPTAAVNVPPPPIPPNPQKDALLSAISRTLTQQVQSTQASNQAAITPLRAQQSALTSTLNNINREISQLEDLEALLSNNEAMLHQAMRESDQVLEDAKRRKIPDVDEVLVAPTVVAGQLYQLVAEQRAIEDCRAILGKALDKGRIGSSVWAKQTRSLAREEFMKKALIKKIATGMGLVEQHDW